MDSKGSRKKIALAITCLILSSLSAQQAIDPSTKVPYITVTEMFTSPLWTNEMRWAYAMGALDTGRTLQHYLRQSGLAWQGDLIWNKLYHSMSDNLEPFGGQIERFTAAVEEAERRDSKGKKSLLPALYIFLLPWHGEWVWGNYEVTEDDPAIIEQAQ